jgi:zinc protease
MRVLNKHLPRAMELFEDVLLRPRFDEADFQRLQTQSLVDIDARGDSARTVASNVWRRLMYGEDGPQGYSPDGTRETIESLTVADIKAFYREHVVPAGARLTVIGDVDAAGVRDLFASISDAWTTGEVAPIALAARPELDSTTIFLVDKPGAPQSEIRIGHEGVSALDESWYPLYVMNYSLGGAFSSRINMNLREDKGYTYGARTRFSGNERPGTFTASSGVRTDVTKESVIEFMKELNGARDGLTAEEVTFSKDALTQAMNRQFESIRSLSGYVDNISKLGYPDDYPLQRLKLLESLDPDDLNALTREYVRPDRMAILVVGDASAVKAGLEELGYGDVVELDIDGNPPNPEL